MEKSVEELILLIESNNRAPARQLWVDLKAHMADAPGSSRSHHAWEYGYRDHIQETMNIAISLYDTLNQQRRLPFTVGSALLVMFLHDCEKPFRYASEAQLSNFPWVTTHPSKSDKGFQKELIKHYGFSISDEEWNALAYVEGEKDDYREGTRVMGPLAALCHASDVISARIWFDQPRSSDQS